MARTSREGDRVEPAALTAGSVTLQNGACHFQVPGTQPTGTVRTSVLQPESDQTTEPLTVATRYRELVDRATPLSLTGRYA